MNFKNYRSTQRFVVEGIWSGYRSSQQRPCHRRVVSRWKAEALSKITAVQFTDNTTMTVTVRPAEKYEKVKEIHGYDDLLDDALHKRLEGWIRVPF